MASSWLCDIVNEVCTVTWISSTNSKSQENQFRDWKARKTGDAGTRYLAEGKVSASGSRKARYPASFADKDVRLLISKGPYYS